VVAEMDAGAVRVAEQDVAGDERDVGRAGGGSAGDERAGGDGQGGDGFHNRSTIGHEASSKRDALEVRTGCKVKSRGTRIAAVVYRAGAIRAMAKRRART